MIKIRTTGIEDYLEGGNANVKCLILGKPKVGKTRSACFWPKPILLDADEGRMSVADLKVPYVTLDNVRTASSDVIDLLDHLKRDAVQPVERRKYMTLIVDTFDSMQRKIIAERLSLTGNAGLSGWEDWGWLDAKMQAIMERLSNLNMNVVVNVHTQTKQEGDDGPTYTEPALKGNIRSSIAADFDLVGRMGTYWEAVEGERVLKRAIWWAPQPNLEILGDRTGTFPAMTQVNFDISDYSQLFEPLKAKATQLTAGEAFDEVVQKEVAEPVSSGMKGGPVTPTRTSVVAPKAPSKPVSKVAEPVTEPAARRAKPMEVQEDGAGLVPAASVLPEATTPVVVPSGPLPTVSEPASPRDEAASSHDGAVESVKDVLGGKVISESPLVDKTLVVPTPSGEPPLTCGTPGPLKDGSINPAPVSGCGGNIREIATTKKAQDVVNMAFMRTRTFLCPACYTASQVQQDA